MGHWWAERLNRGGRSPLYPALLPAAPWPYYTPLKSDEAAASTAQIFFRRPCAGQKQSCCCDPGVGHVTPTSGVFWSQEKPLASSAAFPRARRPPRPPLTRRPPDRLPRPPEASAATRPSEAERAGSLGLSPVSRDLPREAPGATPPSPQTPTSTPVPGAPREGQPRQHARPGAGRQGRGRALRDQSQDRLQRVSHCPARGGKGPEPTCLSGDLEGVCSMSPPAARRCKGVARRAASRPCLWA